MSISLNSITYGNPDLKTKKILAQKCLVDDLYPKLINFPFPTNESDSTKQELNESIEKIRDITDKDNAKYLNRYTFYDRNLLQAILNNINSDEYDFVKLVNEIDKDINPLIMRLKYFYQRPRPFQLSSYYKLKLFPFNSTSDKSPSYPSGSTIKAYVILNVLGCKEPILYKTSKKMIDDIANSRTYLGLNYPTDNDFSYQVAQEILKHKSFTQKYGI